MSGDYTRFTFDPRRDHSGVLMQQGRVMLDADFNELVELIDRRLRAETIDIIGHCIVPSETPDAFLIGLAGGGITIGPGRMYADGLLAENHGGEPREWYAALEEERGTTPIAYDAQPYLPDAANLQPAPTQGGPYLVYADVWKREVTRTEDAGLVEKAVGVDTATRTQTVWQVKVYPPPGSDVGLKGPITCDTPDGDITGWVDFTAPVSRPAHDRGPGRARRPTTRASSRPIGGYRGSENRLYRVEVHDPGGLGAATFKWSRDNASIATNVLAIDAARTELTVTRTARDAVLRFSTGDWVEVTDDEHELYGLPGVMRKVGAGRRRRVDADAHDGTAGRHVRRDRPASPHPDQALGPEGDRPRRRPERRGRRRRERRRHQGPRRGHDRSSSRTGSRSRCRSIPAGGRFRVGRLLGLRRSNRGRLGRRAGQGTAARHPPPLLPARDRGLRRQGRA